MTATNHVVTGALIGALIAGSVHQPILALPLALLSHLVLDAIPHSGWVKDKRGWSFKLILLCDMACASAVLLAILLLQPAHWPLLLACAILAASPDLIWLPYWIKELRGRPVHFNLLARFLAKIQWAERPWGAFVEIAWLAGVGSLLLRHLNL